MAQQAPAVEDLGPLEVEDLGPLSTAKPSDKNPDAKTSVPTGSYDIGRRRLEMLRDMGVGAVRGAVSTVQGLASPIRQATGMAPATPPPEETTVGGKIGRGVEQAAEFFLPTEAASGVQQGLKAAGVAKAARTAVGAAVAGAGTYGIAKAQGDPNPKTAAALAATGPVAEAAGPATYKWLRDTSKASLAKFFGSSPLEPKAVRRAIQSIVPTALNEGIPASWKTWAQQAEAAMQRKGAAVATVVAGPGGDAWTSVKPVIDALEELKHNAAEVMMPVGVQKGQKVSTAVMTKDDALLREINRLQAKLKMLPDHGDVPARVLHDLKSTWNDIVYAKKSAGELNYRDLLLNAKKKAYSTAVGAIRDVLDQAAPSITEVDKAYRISKELHANIVEAALNASGQVEQKVSNAVATALKRSTVLSGAATGGAVGYREGGIKGAVGGAIVGGLTGRMLERAFQSPGWKLLVPKAKNALAQAIARGDVEQVREILAPLLTKASAGSPQ